MAEDFAGMLSEYRAKYGNDTDNERILRDLVGRSVMCCVSSLMSTLMQNWHNLDGIEFDDETLDKLAHAGVTDLELIENAGYAVEEFDGEFYWFEDLPAVRVCKRELKDGTVYTAVKKGEPRPRVDDADWYDTAREATLEYYKYIDAVNGPFDTEDEAAEACRQENGVDNDREAYEHWVVDSHLAQRLEARGENVVDFGNLNIWCRGCSGQAIYMDGVIEEIAFDMEILKGQKYDWSRRED